MLQTPYVKENAHWETETSQMSKTKIRTKPEGKKKKVLVLHKIEQLNNLRIGVTDFLVLFSVSQRNSPIMNSTDLTKVNEWSG